MAKWVAGAVAALLLAGSAGAVPLPGNSGFNLIDALRKGDDAKAIELLRADPNLVNARDSKGETPLLTAIGKRDQRWTGYLLTNDADPNLAARNGETPLIAASRSGFRIAVEWLLGVGAKVDVANRMGETPLIVAVQQRQPQIARLLLEAGADPDKADAAAGYSARDYAKRDTRNPEIARLIEAAKPAAR